MRQIRITRDKKIVAQLIERQIRRSDFVMEVESFRKKYKIVKPSNIVNKDLFSKKYESKHIPGSYVWETDLSLLLQRLGLDVHKWGQITLDYITTGKYNHHNDPEGIVVEEEITDVPNYKKTDFSIKIFPTTTKADIIRAWPAIEKFVKGRSTKTKSSKNSERDNLIYELHNEKKMSYKEIVSVISDNFGEILDLGHLKSIVSKQKGKIAKDRTLYYKK